MTNKERMKLNRLYNMLKIPKFASGSQSTTMHGISSYANDCAYAITKAMEILYAIGAGDPYSDDADKLLDEMFEWFSKRINENWQ